MILFCFFNFNLLFQSFQIHIKTEHLNWLPFRCLKCPATRASDTQIREHMFSAHKNDKGVRFFSTFIYIQIIIILDFP